MCFGFSYICVLPGFVSREGLMPDLAMVHGRMLVCAWETGLADVQDTAVKLLMLALEVTTLTECFSPHKVPHSQPAYSTARTKILKVVIKVLEGPSGSTKTGLPTCNNFRGTYRFWPSITISRFHAMVYRFWKMQEFLGLADFVLFCFPRYSRILPSFCTYRQSRRCVSAINSPLYAMNQC